MIGFKEPEVLFHTASLGHTGALGTELDYRDAALYFVVRSDMTNWERSQLL